MCLALTAQSFYIDVQNQRSRNKLNLNTNPGTKLGPGLFTVPLEPHLYRETVPLR